MDNLFIITQNAILLNEKNEALILRDPRGKWLLPGGRMEARETWLKGLKREVFEEAKIKDFKITNIIDIDNWYDKNENKYFYGVTFVGTVRNITKIKLSDEHDQYAWINSKTLNQYEFWHKHIKQRLEKILKK